MSAIDEIFFKCSHEGRAAFIPFLMAGDLVRFDPTTIHAWMLAEADRKREKKRGLRAIHGKVAPAPGGCNRKGATG